MKFSVWINGPIRDIVQIWLDGTRLTIWTRHRIVVKNISPKQPIRRASTVGHASSLLPPADPVFKLCCVQGVWDNIKKSVRLQDVSLFLSFPGAETMKRSDRSFVFDIWLYLIINSFTAVSFLLGKTLFLHGIWTQRYSGGKSCRQWMQLPLFSVN